MHFTVGYIRVSLNTFNSLNQAVIFEGKQKSLLALRAERNIIFFAFKFLLSASTKAFSNQSKKKKLKLEGHWIANYRPHLIKVMSESIEIIQGLKITS